MDHDDLEEHVGGDRTEQPADAGEGGAPPVDIARLAEKVRQLMLDELRLDKARGSALGGRTRSW